MSDALSRQQVREMTSVLVDLAESVTALPPHITREIALCATAEALYDVNARYRLLFGCPSCEEDHPDQTMCPPHEMRTTGQAWFHWRFQQADEAIARLTAENAALRAELQKQSAETQPDGQAFLGT